MGPAIGPAHSHPRGYRRCAAFAKTLDAAQRRSLPYNFTPPLSLVPTLTDKRERPANEYGQCHGWHGGPGWAAENLVSILSINDGIGPPCPPRMPLVVLDGWTAAGPASASRRSPGVAPPAGPAAAGLRPGRRPRASEPGERAGPAGPRYRAARAFHLSRCGDAGPRRATPSAEALGRHCGHEVVRADLAGPCFRAWVARIRRRAACGSVWINGTPVPVRGHQRRMFS